MVQQTVRITLDSELTKSIKQLEESGIYAGLKKPQLFRMALLKMVRNEFTSRSQMADTIMAVFDKNPKGLNMDDEEYRKWWNENKKLIHHA